MYADPHALLRLAHELRARGDEARHLAHALTRDAREVDWHGASADAMRRVTRLGHDSLLTLADEHDDVARLLTEHAHHVADRLGIALDVLGALDWLGHVA